MKSKYFNILIIYVIGLLYACQEESIGQQPVDSNPPNPVTNVTVRNISGGAIIHYTLPDDEDLLYVKALYYLKDSIEIDTRASVYVDSLVVVGFGDMKERQVRLIAVDRSQNESSAVTVSISPLSPDVLNIGESLNLIQDFGGVHAYWDNPNKVDIAIAVLTKDHNEEYVPLETFYSSRSAGEGTIRGMDTIPYDFTVYAEDRWGNKSEQKYYTLTPIYETKFDRLKFARVDLAGDASQVSGFEMHRMWDGNNNGDPCFSTVGGTGLWPQSATMDMGITGKISRIRIFQRMSLKPYIWGEGNLRKFQVYGCETLDYSGGWDNWTLLMDCVSVKPSGLPLGQNTDEDIYVATNGEDFTNSPTNPPVRYLRFLVTQTWAGGDNFQIGEIEIYGDDR